MTCFDTLVDTASAATSVAVTVTHAAVTFAVFETLVDAASAATYAVASVTHTAVTNARATNAASHRSGSSACPHAEANLHLPSRMVVSFSQNSVLWVELSRDESLCHFWVPCTLSVGAICPAAEASRW